MVIGVLNDIDEVMNEINMTPLVDVMLVPLVKFILTVPVLQHAVKVDLPRAGNAVVDARPQTLRVSVDAQGSYFWNETVIDDKELPRRPELEVAREPKSN